jgi:hypothetical protein
MRDWGSWFLNGWFETTRGVVGQMGSALKYLIHS